MARLLMFNGLSQQLTSSEVPATPIVLLGAEDAVLGSAHCGLAAEDLQEVADTLPSPLAIQGAFAASLDDAVKAAAQLQKLGFASSGSLAATALDGKLQAVRLTASGAAGPALEVKPLAALDEWLQGQRVFRCQLPLRLEVVEDGTTHAAAAMQAAVSGLIQQLETPGVSYLAWTRNGGVGSKQLLQHSSDGLVDSLAGIATSNSVTGEGFINCSPVLATTALAAPPAGPAFAYRPLGAPSAGAAAASTSATVRLDVLVYVRHGSRVSAAVSAVTRALVAQLQAAQRVLGRQNAKVLPVRAYHFLPPGCGHHVTVLYPSLLADTELNDLKLLPLRQRLHALLGLPTNRPLLRPANALELAGEADGEGGAGGGSTVARLRDVHVGLAAPGIGGLMELVQGNYEYCHYMQDRFNDSGWGCAYRSLQTIVSWFRLQKYTTKPIPSHKLIQQTLVKLGDKPASFVGSSNWIGAIELSYVLDDYLGVSCKFLTVNRGADIPSHARELAAHFATVGSPVMIGGGVLAYTLLGVRFNESTGEAAFLILDPHYTGGEDLKKIQHGTWVGWKQPGDSAAAGGPLFVEDAFYNFLLPQRPNTV
ncbi:hypothetical protein HYH02_012686 [Chlamydomonas schloesseri]|uniref:Ufm1-specific protease n=1 Tax=Chlamydomonas schloesseri TaxID=2026947 RepID=A0A835SUR9_9CHLO|nr:hypothetical protein HYH02_012686 [Chlamydomonas schloesseri]|eukprot:KAG2433569.1 hypothetical protein HYH02_012686 [Chlamydomonas schloesseri]